MKRYLLNLLSFFLLGVLGYTILIYSLTERIILAYKAQGFGPGFEGQYYFIAISFTVSTAIVLFLLGAILMGLITFLSRKNKEGKFSRIISLISGTFFGILLFFMQFGFDVFLKSAIYQVGQ